MKVLLDTNVIIHRENTKATNYGIGLLFYWLDKLNYEKCIHPYVIEELRSLHNKNIQDLYDAKLAAYTELHTVAKQTEDFIVKLPFEKSHNDAVDNQLLFEVYSGRVDVLITEDKALRDKARLFSIRNKVLSINDFISICTAENPSLISYKMLAVKKEYFGNIDINNPFFDTFRSDYLGFNEWFAKKSNEEAYICRTEKNEIIGFLYIKTEDEKENYSEIEPTFNPKRRLKIGTFKIETSGFRLGERFIKIIFDNAIARHVDEIYVTLFEDRPELKALEDLLSAWGFTRHGVKKSHSKEEIVLIKQLNTYNESFSVKYNFPNILYRRNKFILPIFPKYHTTLLPDSKLNTENEVDFIDNVAHRYALDKVYISWSSNSTNTQPGDLILFYRTGENEGRKAYESVLTSLGVIESIYKPKSKNELLQICKNRSVFSKEELEKFWNGHSWNLSIIKFIFVKNLTKRPILKELWERNIVPEHKGPRPFDKISDEQFNNILELSETKITFTEK
ncbi:MAG: hypothetical protein GX677_03600 [Treponema sp.]|jgi:predicted nucleic acid-binding protein|nr:hypothetical protein [Treponema sp.]